MTACTRKVKYRGARSLRHPACGWWTAALALAAGLGLSACGTTSQLEAPAAGQTIDLSRYDRLLVEDFTDAASSKANPKAKARVEAAMTIATRTFPDAISAEVRKNGGFSEVLRKGQPDAKTLVLRGAIEQWDEGNEALRLMVGFGAGNSNLDAKVQLVDGGSNAVLGTWVVDKNSWALGGAIAASQGPAAFMQEAARKIGTELSEKRKAGSIDRPPPQR